MPRNERPTPEGRPDKWKKLWGTPRPLDDDTTTQAFEELIDALVPSHMHKRFFKTFGVPRASFGNRFFRDEARFYPFDTRFGSLLDPNSTYIEVSVIYGSTDSIEGWALRGEVRRTIRDLFVDDWHPACAILRSENQVLYAFIEPKMKGCVIYAREVDTE